MPIVGKKHFPYTVKGIKEATNAMQKVPLKQMGTSEADAEYKRVKRKKSGYRMTDSGMMKK